MLMVSYCRAPDRGRFCVFDAKKMGKKRLQSQTDASKKRPLKPGLTHREKTDASFLHMCWSKKCFFFFFKFQYFFVGGKLNPSSFTHSNSRKIFQTKEMHSIALINSPCQKLAQRSAFEVKDSAPNDTCRHVNFLT